MEKVDSKIRILLTGASGQLGRSLQSILQDDDKIELLATDVDQMDICKPDLVKVFFDRFKPDFCINAAAYTQVDQAETEMDIAAKINDIGPGILANACAQSNTFLVHISTDYVYHSNTTAYMMETDPVEPKGIYAQTKLNGEEKVKDELQSYVILRTSWLYSEYGHNFVKTMLTLAKQGKNLRIVSDQYGTPTYALDLARAILSLVFKLVDQPEIEQSKFSGVYNMSNTGATNWFEFAKKILQLSGISTNIEAIQTKDYPTAAVRPLNSRLNLSKIKDTFGIEIRDWEEALEDCIQRLKSIEK